MLLIETLKSKISDFLNSNTCVCSQLYGKYFFPELSARLNEMQEKCHAVEARRLERQRVIDAEAKEDINKQLLIANIKLSILTLWQYVISKKVKKKQDLFIPFDKTQSIFSISFLRMALCCGSMLSPKR